MYSAITSNLISLGSYFELITAKILNKRINLSASVFCVILLFVSILMHSLIIFSATRVKRFEYNSDNSVDCQAEIFLKILKQKWIALISFLFGLFVYTISWFRPRSILSTSMHWQPFQYFHPICSGAISFENGLQLEQTFYGLSPLEYRKSKHIFRIYWKKVTSYSYKIFFKHFKIVRTFQSVDQGPLTSRL